MSEELKPCPFCGSTNLSIETNSVQPDDFHDAHVVCDDCDATGRHAMTLEGWLSSKEEAKVEAATAWNRRAAAPVPASSVREPVMADGKTPLSDYLEAGEPTLEMDDWTQGYEECRRRLFGIVGTQLRALRSAPVAARELDVEAERREFEREALRHDVLDDEGLNRNEDGDYVDDVAQAAWKSWLLCAARSAAQGTVPAPAKELTPFQMWDAAVAENGAIEERGAQVLVIETPGALADVFKAILAAQGTQAESAPEHKTRFAAQVSTEQAGDAVAAHLYEWIGEECARKKGGLIARTPDELGGNIDLYPRSWRRVGALVLAAQSPNNSPVGGKDKDQ